MGDGVKTVGLEAGVYFDHDADGFAEASGWADPEDALLVWDRNGNGQIDDGGELFGNNTILKNEQKAANGFVALRELDTNRDYKIEANDENWSELRLWQDRNGNGKVDDGELLTLDEAGITGLEVRYSSKATRTSRKSPIQSTSTRPNPAPGRGSRLQPASRHRLLPQRIATAPLGPD